MVTEGYSITTVVETVIFFPGFPLDLVVKTRKTFYAQGVERQVFRVAATNKKWGQEHMWQENPPSPLRRVTSRSISYASTHSETPLSLDPLKPASQRHGIGIHNALFADQAPHRAVVDRFVNSQNHQRLILTIALTCL